MPLKRAGKLNAFLQRIENAIKRGLIEGGNVVAIEATERAPRDTGRLKRSITTSNPKQIKPGAWKIRVGPAGGETMPSELADYAAAQEFGSGIHAEKGEKKRIEPKGNKPLGFNWKNAPIKPTSKSGLFFFWSVAGVKAQPYLRPALKAKKAIAKALLIKNLRAAF